MRELFVYYKVRVGNTESARFAVQAMQARLRALHPGLDARLLRRPETVDGAQTWMEIYVVDAGRSTKGVGGELQATIEAEATALIPMLDGPRHTEVFIAA